MMAAVQAPALEEIGDLGTTPVEQVLASFVRHGATGALFLAAGLKQKAVELVEGVPAAVYSNLDA